MKSLKDLDSTEGTVQLHSKGADGHLILHPKPNPNDPNDPLRWVSKLMGQQGHSNYLVDTWSVTPTELGFCSKLGLV
jgi:hypothetical protein